MKLIYSLIEKNEVADSYTFGVRDDSGNLGNECQLRVTYRVSEPGVPAETWEVLGEPYRLRGVFSGGQLIAGLMSIVEQRYNEDMSTWSDIFYDAEGRLQEITIEIGHSVGVGL